MRSLGTVATVVLVLAWTLALVHQPLPSVERSGAAAQELARVFTHLQFMSTQMRVRGTTHHADTVNYLVHELAETGHSATVQEARLFSAPVRNVVAVAPGRASTGTVVVMAHYDSVPGCPGASDDGAGAAAALEAFIQIAREGQRNDVVLLLTDGEELSMHGATAFVEQHALFGSVRAVVNLESLGNAGPAWLFETGPEDGRWTRAFASTAPLPIGNSLAEPIYRTLMSRRNTDFTRFRDKGIGGLNFANVWGASANHQPFDTFENVSRRSVAHLYDSGRAALRVVADADLAEEPLPGPVFFELPGFGMIAIAPLTSRLLSAMAVAMAALVAWRTTRREGWRRAWLGLGAGLVALVIAIGAAVAATHGLRALVGVLELSSEPVGNVLSMQFFAFGVATLVAGLLTAVARRMNLPTGCYVVPWALAVIALEATFPSGAHQAALPLLVVSAAAAVPARWRPVAALIAVAGSMLLLGPLLRTLPQIISQILPAATLASAFPSASLTALALVPFGALVRPRRALAVALVGLVAVGVWAILDALGR